MAIITALTQRLGIRHPVLLAPMDLVADGRLCAAVTAAGGYALLGGGYGEEAWLRREIACLERDNGGARHGIGFITWSLAKQPHLLEMALAYRPSAVLLSFGDPQPFVDKIKRAGALLICQVQTVAMAKDAAAKGADILIAQGAEAGGHGVSRGTLGLVPAVVDAVPAEIPVVAAGGIADGRGLAAALALGAAGVMIGTRFYASEEAAGARAAKERICAVSGDDTIRSIVFDISRRNVWPAPFNGRCLVNEQTRRWVGREMDLMRRIDEEGRRYQAAREAENFDIAAVIAGEASDLITRIERAAAIVDGMVRQAEEILTRNGRTLVAP